MSRQPQRRTGKAWRRAREQGANAIGRRKAERERRCPCPAPDLLRVWLAPADGTRPANQERPVLQIDFSNVGTE